MMRKARATTDEHWIPLSDLMSGLMMIFMLVAVLFMLEVEEKSREASAAAEQLSSQAQQISEQAQQLNAQAQQITERAAKEAEMKDVLLGEMQQEFNNDLQRWNAEIDSDLTVRFTNPEVLFASGSADVSEDFKIMLDDFFPRYIRMLQDQKYADAILEIRIEGHTSSKWDGAASPTDAYLNNMALSQARTRNVLAHVVNMYWPTDTKQWLVTNLTANGLSSSKPILNGLGEEDMARSQRVEFKVRTRNATTPAF